MIATGQSQIQPDKNTAGTAGGQKQKIQPGGKSQKYSWGPKAKNTAQGQKPKIQPGGKKLRYSWNNVNKANVNKVNDKVSDIYSIH